MIILTIADILKFLAPEPKAGEAGKLAEAAAAKEATEVSEEIIQKSARGLSEKLEQDVAQKGTKESFKEAETNLEDRIPEEKKIEEVILKNSKAERANALAKWASKFEKKFHLHFDGEFKIKLKRGVEKLEGTGGHNHSVIGQNIKVRKYLTEPVDNMPFDALIEVRYKNGQWIEKIAKSSMFPKNWDVTRVKEEVALVYDEMMKSGFELKWENNKYFGKSSTGFEIQIEVDKSGI